MNTDQAIILQKEKSIIDVATGEVVALKDANEDQVSGFLTVINNYNKQYTKVEKMVKDWIKKKFFDQNKLDDNGVMFVGRHRVSEYYRASFDSKRFELEGSAKEKKIKEQWDEIQSKYTMKSQTIKIM